MFPAFFFFGQLFFAKKSECLSTSSILTSSIRALLSTVLLAE